MSAKSARLFFGASLPLDVARALVEPVRPEFEAAGWRILDPGDLHITFLFLGSVPVGRIGELTAARADLALVRGFEVGLDSLGAFPSTAAPSVAWAGGAELSAATHSLHDCLHALVERLGLPVEPRTPIERWTAHVTFGRPAQGRRAAWPRDLRFEQRFGFRIDAVTLFESLAGGASGHRYRTVDRIPLIRPPG